MFCSNCGKEIMDGSSFCSNCGTALNTDIQSSKNLQQSQTTDKKIKNHSKAKLIVGIVLIFLCFAMFFDGIILKTGLLAELLEGKLNIENIVKLFLFIGMGIGGIYLIIDYNKK